MIAGNVLPQPVLDLLAGACAGAPIADIAPTSGGFSHRSAAATIGGQRCIVKAAEAAPKRADLRREARILALLPGSGLPTPRLRALVEDHAWTVEVLGFVGGAQGLQLLSDRTMPLAQVYGALGRLLADVHSAPLAVPDTELLVAGRAAQALRQLPNLGLGAELHAALAESLEHPAWRPAAPALVHGDAGLHNLLWDGGIAALLDWEWAGWGNPLLDLAWVYWTMRWRSLPGQLWPAFLAGYRAGRPAADPHAPGALRALALGQIAGILARVQADTGAREEWVRRARWTLGLDFPAHCNDLE
jgi:aminoglycoside phosphotransferase (APT) family kinase protein